MPYYLDEYNDEAKKILRYSVCAECGSELRLFTDYEKGKFYLACSRNWEHNGIAREYTERPELNILTRREQMEQEYGKERSTALTKSGLPLSGRLNQEQAMTVLRLVYPEVPDPEIQRTAILCRDFGLHPLMKEVYIIPFKKKWKDEHDKWHEETNWATVLGINATRKMMARMGSFSYIDNTPRVMTEQEQKDIFGEVQEGKVQAITKLRTKGGLEAQGYGSYLLKDSPYGMDKGNTKANMAFIRSERQAFSRLFPDAIPQELEIVDEAYVEGVGLVNKKTGEIKETIEGEFKEVQGTLETPVAPEPTPDEPEPAPEPKAEAKQPAKRDENPISQAQAKELQDIVVKAGMTMGQLWKVCTDAKWTITKLGDLKVWQFEELKARFAKGKS